VVQRTSGVRDTRNRPPYGAIANITASCWIARPFTAATVGRGVDGAVLEREFGRASGFPVDR
jgi:hypothetical protein